MTDHSQVQSSLLPHSRGHTQAPDSCTLVPQWGETKHTYPQIDHTGPSMATYHQGESGEGMLR